VRRMSLELAQLRHRAVPLEFGLRHPSGRAAETFERPGLTHKRHQGRVDTPPFFTPSSSQAAGEKCDGIFARRSELLELVGPMRRRDFVTLQRPALGWAQMI
jgi:hypothetical protein